MISDRHLFVNIHSHQFSELPENVFRVVNIIAGLDELPLSGYFSAGIHPWYISGKEASEVNRVLFPLIREARCLAVGECGLDKIRGDFPEIQKAIFLEHIYLSESIKKPLIIHAVKSSGEIVQIYSKNKPVMPWIIHGFNNPGQIALQFLKAGFYLSLGPSFFKRADAAEICRLIPNGRFFLETDDSKTDIESIYWLASACKGMPIEELIRKLKENFKNCFLHG